MQLLGFARGTPGRFPKSVLSPAVAWENCGRTSVIHGTCPRHKTEIGASGFLAGKIEWGGVRTDAYHQ